MGRYFGVNNVSQDHSVSEGTRCWKAGPWCDMHSVMHRYGWKPTDKIYSSAYDSVYVFVYSPENNTMSLDEYETDDDDDSDDDEFDYTGKEEKDENTTPIQMGFNMSSKDIEITSTHCPVWENGHCKTCQYTLDFNSITEDQKSFNSVFFCN